MKTYLLLTLLIAFTSAQDSTPVGGLFNLFSNIFRQSTNTVSDAIKLGAETGTRFTNYGLNQARDWTNATIDGVGRGSRFAAQFASNVTKGVQRLLTDRQRGFNQILNANQNAVQNTTNITNTIPDELSQSARQTINTLERQITELRENIQLLANNSWIREIKERRLLELQKQLNGVLNSENSNSNTTISTTVSLTEYGAVTSTPLTSTTDQLSTSTNGNLPQDDSILPIFS